MGKKPGRPSLYTEALATTICERLASGESLNSICKADEMPSERTVRTWALDPMHPFSPNYVRARELGYLKMADELLDISDDGTNDYRLKLNADGEQVGMAVDHDHIARSRLRVDTRKWILSKALPKVFGDRIVTEHTGKDGGPIETAVVELSEAERARRVAFILQRGLAPEANQ